MHGFLELEKARGDRARIEEFIVAAEASTRRAFRRFLDEVRSPAVRRQVLRALQQEGVEAALRVIDDHVVRLGTAITRAFQDAGYHQADILARQLRSSAAHVAISFDPTNPRAAAAMRRNTLQFIVEFSQSQREATRAALVEALSTGAGPIQAGRAFRESIGLTNYQRGVVANYRRALERGEASALTRDLRDRRYDGSVRRLLTEGKPLGAKRINTMVDRYRGRFLQLRAETIARTEMARTTNLARSEATIQALDQAGLPRSAARQTWQATADPRVRDTHAAMSGQVRPVGVPFDSPSGAQLMFPGDVSLGAPAEEVINCRCVLTTDVG